MAIKVIKHGESKFRTTCPICGCEFEYEYEDLDKTWGKARVKCPDCGEFIDHKEYVVPTYPTYPNIPQTPWYPNQPDTIPQWPWVYPNIIYCSDWTGNLDCSKCSNRPDPSKPVVGDTPCTWCKKNQPYCTSYTGGTSYTINTQTDSNLKK